jgi:hypothetical protein
MMADEFIHVDDVGTSFVVTLIEDGEALDVHEATTKRIIFKKPDGTLLTKEAEFASSGDEAGTDGQIECVSASGDLDQAGVWSLQAYIAFGSSRWHSDTTQFRVMENL